MNEQIDKINAATRANETVDHIFDAVRNELQDGLPKYRNAKDVWAEGTRRITALYLNLSHDPKIDENYLIALKEELSHIRRIATQSFMINTSGVKETTEDKIIFPATKETKKNPTSLGNKNITLERALKAAAQKRAAAKVTITDPFDPKVISQNRAAAKEKRIAENHAKKNSMQKQHEI